MVKMFSSQDLIEMAIHIEEEGEKFYELMGSKVEDEELKKLFSYLALEEKRHALAFKEIYSRLENEGFVSAYPDQEANKYLHAFVDSQIFIDWDKLSTRTIWSLSEVLDLAISLEKDSILFYYEMEKYIPEKDKNILYEIIKQEKMHLSQLTEFKKGIKN
ncbi:ferritin family protein [Dictyoglomus thermophilum]|uniref:ferritin-like domain-containing protein n=1 Tax=Dictyoglomus thermophilum TaxID=14 RepID=UPI0011EA723F|nr:ferritin family protein [Dictyoglomus thermophilum]TYT23195.1 ferritin family protein [Dictyoglomus thermophilum]